MKLHITNEVTKETEIIGFDNWDENPMNKALYEFMCLNGEHVTLKMTDHLTADNYYIRWVTGS